MLERHGLNRAFSKLRNHRVIAVCAPAGYGKTVAVKQWLDKDSRAKAIFLWMNLTIIWPVFVDAFVMYFAHVNHKIKLSLKLFLTPLSKVPPMNLLFVPFLSSLSESKRYLL